MVLFLTLTRAALRVSLCSSVLAPLVLLEASDYVHCRPLMERPAYGDRRT